MTFKERYLRGECSISVINDWADAWRKAGLDHRTLPAALGLSEDEYRLWAVVGDDALAERLSGSVTAPYVALHLDWDELENRLQDLIHSLLGTEYDISIQRMDYYYWDLKLTIPYDLGLAVILQEAIQEIEGIELTARDDFNGVKYLIYQPSYP